MGGEKFESIFAVDQLPDRSYTLFMHLTIEVIHDGAFNLLSDMERLDLIRLNSPAKNSTAPAGCTASEKKLSQQFAGALRLSDTAYEAYKNTLREGRDEWRRDIY